ncbi:DMT family transporter [uncultured Sphingomonas sp.]|uniref:DMT family transporter n=1 Tax=uncultured Sphingomonas sp. TaxID=158754 RepID=UPI0035C99E24
MSWLILALAIVAEVCWALSLKWASTAGTWVAGLVPITLSFITMGMLALAMRGLAAGTAYSIWSGLGAVGVIVGGVILFGERVSLTQGCFMALTMIGVVGTKLFSPS